MGKVRIGRVEVEVRGGNIVDIDAEALVNAANNHFWMGSGVAGAIRDAAGSEIEAEAMNQGPRPVGDSVVTSAGRLGARYVIHAAVMGQDLRTDGGNVYRATRSALETARGLGVRSVALPAFGTGVGGLEGAESAEAMTRAVVDFAREGPGLPASVTLVLFSASLEQEFDEALSRNVSRGV